jgi:type VI secretion system secreted protein Hcp
MSEKQPHERSGLVAGATANRRAVLRTAGGLVAATALAGALFDVSPETAAAAKAANRLVVTIDDDGNQSQFDATSMSFGVSNQVIREGGGGSSAGRASFSDVTMTKYIDATTPRLQGWVASGKHLRSVRLALVDDRGKNELGSIALDDVLVTSDQIAVAGGDSQGLAESVSFSFDQIELTVSGVSFRWDVGAGRAS